MKRTLLYFMSSLALALATQAQPQFRTQELRRLATELHIDQQQLVEGNNHPVANGRQLSVRMTDGTIDHVGLLLFSEQVRSISGRAPVLDFLERYFLQLQYPPRTKTTANMMRDDQLRFATGSLETINQLRQTDDFTYNCSDNRYHATWTRRGKPFLSVSFPVEYELISGENKIEAENNIMADIKRAVPAQPMSVPDAGLLVKAGRGDAYYILRGDHYISRDLNGNLYYQRQNQDLRLVSGVTHLAESAANLMLSPMAEGSYDLNVTQVSYGFKKTVFDVPLQSWLAFCQSTGCQLYFGVDRIEQDGSVSAVVLAVNQTENYNHVLTVTIPFAVLDQQQGTISARLYPYVPTHNVKNMFGDYKVSRRKQKYLVR